MRVLMLGLAVLVAALAPTQSFADDQQIADFIKAKLLEEKQRGNLFGFNVDMRVDRGTVWFQGFVSNQTQEAMILRTAQMAGHLGVVQVVDDIDVNQTPMSEVAPQHTMLVPQRQKAEMPMKMNAPAMQPMPMAQSSAMNAATSVAYQEPVRNGGIQAAPGIPAQQIPGARGGFNYPQPGQMGAPPTFQNNVLSPIQANQNYPAPQQIASPPRPTNPYAAQGTPFRNVGTAGQPLPFARAAGPNNGQTPVAAPMAAGGFAGGTGIVNDNANLPGYAWPAYASHPNYGAVSYPKQYSPSAWPYIGPFYPYPQVPLGWRKVSLEWDDGWWFLDFDDRN